MCKPAIHPPGRLSPSGGSPEGGTLALPRVMVAALHGKSGKTVIVAGLLRALKNRGIDVQPFKKGPDYIDPGWHAVAAGRASRNVDPFFMDGSAMCGVMRDASAGAHLGLIEGAMGVFDGSDTEGSSSSAEVAKQTKTPVVLVLDVTRMTRSAAAAVLGCKVFDPEMSLAGVILNHVRSARHEARVREAIEHYCAVPVIGAVPEDGRLCLADRHLGLVPSAEADFAEAFAEDAADVVGGHVDLDALLAIARGALPVKWCAQDRAGIGAQACEGTQPFGGGPSAASPVKIAVVYDQAFNFYYQENLKALESAGAQLVYVDSLNDQELPLDACGLYIGGGFPEVFADQLQENASFRKSVRDRIDGGIAGYAECGGLMYLARSLKVGDALFDMAGAFDMAVEMEQGRQGHGYCVIAATTDHPWLSAGTLLKGHEHHHSRAIVAPGLAFAYENQRGQGIREGWDGVCRKNTVAGYTHVNALASPEWAQGFVAAAHAHRSRSARLVHSA